MTDASGRGSPWALVTGASSGIGAGIARALARRGWNLVLAARREERLQRLAEEVRGAHGVEALVVVSDLAHPDGPGSLYRAVEASGVEVEALVNNAGVGYLAPFLSQPESRDRSTIAVNVTAVTELSKRFGRAMVGRGRGRILNVASTGAFQPGPLLAVYYATKSYVVSFSEALREELAERGVSVTTLCPGPTASEFQERAGIRGSPLSPRFPVPTSAEVAEFGVEAMLAGRGVVIHGRLNRAVALLVRFVPRRWLTRMVRKAQDQRRSGSTAEAPSINS